MDLFKSELIAIEAPNESDMHFNNSDNDTLEYKINKDQLIDLNWFSKSKSNDNNEDYNKAIKIGNNKIKRRLAKLNVRRKRIKKDRIEKKLLTKPLNLKQKKILFKDRFFTQFTTMK